MMKNYDDILKRMDYYDRKIYAKVAELERAKINNEEREKIIAEQTAVMQLDKEINEYQYDIRRLIAALEKEDLAFKERRKQYLSTLITESLAEIFPEDNLRAELNFDFCRKSEVSLELIDEDRNQLIPEMCSGKLQQYLISFAAVAGITKGLNINNMYVDEAFGVAAPEILGEVGQVIKKSVDQGVQVVMIAQNPGLYQDLPRREIRLRKDPITKSVEIISEKDY